VQAIEININLNLIDFRSRLWWYGETNHRQDLWRFWWDGKTVPKPTSTNL